MQKLFGAIIILSSMLAIGSAQAAATCPSQYGCSTLDINITAAENPTLIQNSYVPNSYTVHDPKLPEQISSGYEGLVYGSLGTFGFTINYTVGTDTFVFNMNQEGCSVTGNEGNTYNIAAVAEPIQGSVNIICTLTISEQAPVTKAIVNIFNQTQ
jgi:hypothetical protein